MLVQNPSPLKTRCARGWSAGVCLVALILVGAIASFRSPLAMPAFADAEERIDAEEAPSETARGNAEDAFEGRSRLRDEDDAENAPPRRNTGSEDDEPDQLRRGARVLTDRDVTDDNPTLDVERSDAAIWRAISGPLKRNFAPDFVDRALNEPRKDKSLREFATFLEQTLGVDVQINKEELSEEGLTDDTLVSDVRGGITVRSALGRVLRPLGLTWLVRDEVLVITTRGAAANVRTTRIYELTDLVVPRREGDQEQPEARGGVGRGGGFFQIAPNSAKDQPRNENDKRSSEAGQPATPAAPGGFGGGAGGGGAGGGFGGGSAARPFNRDGVGPLFQIIQSSTGAPESGEWADNGGEGTIRATQIGNVQALVIRQTQAVHEEIEVLLADLRNARQAKGAGKAVETLLRRSSQPAEEAECERSRLRGVEAVRQAEAGIRSALANRLRREFKAGETDPSLQDFAGFLGRTLDIDVQIDRVALEEEGLAPDIPVHSNLKAGITIQAGLERLLRPLSLTWVVRDEALTITTRTAAASLRTTKVYDITDLVALARPAPAGKGPNLGPIMDIIESSTGGPDTGEWMNEGGEGTLTPLATVDIHALVIRQTQAVQAQIEALLADLRRLNRAPEAKRSGGA